MGENRMQSTDIRLTHYRQRIDDALAANLPVSGGLGAVAAARAAVLSPGKRVRPLLALLVADHLGAEIDAVLPAACAVEMIHAASLILDDLPCMDDAATRRGQPSLHRVYGEDVALLAVITLVSGAYGQLAQGGCIAPSLQTRWAQVLARAVGPLGLVGGQERDLRGEEDASLDDIRLLHRRKTAVLFTAAAEMGALAAGSGPETQAAAGRFGEAVGLALQAFDDLADAADTAEIARGSNLLHRLDEQGAHAEARSRLDEAGLALQTADSRLAQVGPYVDLLLSRRAAA